MIMGITGSFGSGKTTVAGMFARLGAYVIDADRIYHSLIKPGKRCYKAIIKNFGKGILRPDGQIDRIKLGQIVFKKKAKLQLLNRTVHPEIIREIKRIANSKKDRIIVIDGALIIESGLYKNLDRLILVRNKTKEQSRRLKRDRLLPEIETRKRIMMQMPLRKKLVFADFIIDNSGTRGETLSQVKKAWETMMR